jgi:hypothetical protein
MDGSDQVRRRLVSNPATLMSAAALGAGTAYLSV